MVSLRNLTKRQIKNYFRTLLLMILSVLFAVLLQLTLTKLTVSGGNLEIT